MAQRAGKPRSYREHATYVYLFSGVGHCARCGGPLWANSAGGGKYFYYRCAAQRRGEVCDDAGIGCRIEQVEAPVAEALRRMRLPEQWQDRIQELAGEQSRADRQLEQREHWQAEIDRAKSGFRVGLLDEAEAFEMKRRAEEEQVALAPLDEMTCGGADRVLAQMAHRWDSLTQQERHEAVRVIIKERQRRRARGRGGWA
jgi:hypothetical protein